MRVAAILGAVLGLLALAVPAARAGAPPEAADLVQGRLIPELTSAAPGTTLWVDLRLQIKPGWHIYWRNPGDAGLPTTLSWTLPPGFSAGDISWPVPEHFVLGTVGDYGYRDAVDLLVPIEVAAGAAPGEGVRLAAEVGWLACADICIPGETALALRLPVGAGASPDLAAARIFAAARGRLPQPAPFETRFTEDAHTYRLLVPAQALDGHGQANASFYPYTGSAIDQAAEPETVRGNGNLELVLPKPATPTPGARTEPTTLDGVLVLRGENGAQRAYAISANPLPVQPRPDAAGVQWWQAVLLAFVGGLILNLMPCVFPILSLKILSLAATSGAGRAERHAQGLAYGAGVVASFALLGGVLVALRAGGAAVGWGFQLQSPIVVGCLAYLLFAMGLGLSGLAEFGAGLMGFGAGFATRSGTLGAFCTGVLATVVATPCTAPFMGTALGFALVAPVPAALAVFLALGAGLAAPLLLASLVPGLHRLFPRPGAWMVFVKQLLAFPLYGTVAWLIWVLLQEVAPESSLGALFGLVLVGFAVWAYGRTQLAARRTRLRGGGIAAAALAASVALLMALPPAEGPAAAPSTGRDGLAYEPFTPARLDELAAEGKPAFVNLTAAWCITCLVNERIALDSDAVRQAFAARGIVPLKGDWTGQSPEITRFLEHFGRSGVPLYLLYDGRSAPVMLPQILTERTVLAAVAKL